MIIECPYCESKVNGKVIGEHESFREDDPWPFKAILLECPVCKNSLLGCQELMQTARDREEWISGNRLWPQPTNSLSWIIPSIVRDSLEEAQKCYNAKAYSACAVMCGRALEGICKEYGTKGKILSSGLKELLDKKIIDERLFQWGEALREHRNLGAHATEEKISKEDAHDLLDFVNAICDYVFVLTDKFEKFMNRKAKKQAKVKKSKRHDSGDSGSSAAEAKS
jgi:hypothetical protein